MEVQRIFDLLTRYEAEFPKEDVLAVKRNGIWEKFSTQQYRENADNFSYGLLEMGINKGDKIATVSNNRPEWNFADMGMSQIGAVHVPIYPTIGELEYKHILMHSSARILILANSDHYDRVAPIAKQISSIEHIYSFDQLEGVKHYTEILELGKKHAHKHKTTLEERKKAVLPDDLCSLIYTSGTTGMPKGVMLTHNNFVSNVLATRNVVDFHSTERSLSFLPLCHVLERMVNYLYQYSGVSIYYAENVDTIGANLKEVKPQYFVTVPRLLEKMYDKFVEKGNELEGIKKGIYFWALDIANNYELKGKTPFYKLKRQSADTLIFKKWREALGGNIRVIVSGGAALQPRLARVFWCAQITVLEGSGLTETSPVIAVNQPQYPFVKFGTVGPVVQSVEVKIDTDGEILVKGPNVMKGYYNDPEKTTEVIDAEGWFHTGDIGVLHPPHNILQITDRKKEIFKLSTGKYVAPQSVENKLKESIFIEQAMVTGADEKYAAAIICPNFVHLHDWCSIHKIHFRDNIDLIQHPKILDRFQKEIDIANKDLSKHEQIKKFELVCENWTTDTGELSPTLKLKRKYVKQKYEIKINRMYGKTQELGHVGKPTRVEEMIQPQK